MLCTGVILYCFLDNIDDDDDDDDDDNNNNNDVIEVNFD
jgi:hypothetical protein